MDKCKIQLSVGILVATGTVLASPVATAGMVSPVQSGASTVYSLDAVAPVQLAGSDQAALEFYNNDMQELLSIVNANLSERTQVGDVTAFALDPNPLFLTDASDVRVYFLGEGAGYRNSFGFYTGPTSAGVTGSSDAALVFPDASENGAYPTNSVTSDRNLGSPVAAGDFVDLGSFDAGTQLNLFLVANGANGGANTWYTDPALNSDGLVHYVALADPGSPYLLMGIEDLPGGGDKDYNDLVVAVDIGESNVAGLVESSGTTSGSTVSRRFTAAAAPLPPSMWAALGVVLVGLRRKYQQKR